MNDSPEGIADAAPGTDILTRTVTGVGSDVSPISEADLSRIKWSTTAVVQHVDQHVDQHCLTPVDA
jgi:hypothetical protein